MVENQLHPASPSLSDSRALGEDAASSSQKEDAVKQDLDRVVSIDQGDLESLHDDDGQFHRSFTPHQVHIISLGSNIGSGLFIGTGSALATGGPGNMILAYALVATCVWAVLQTLSEMTIAFPVSGNFIDYADRWVDPSLAFAAGIAEWLAWVAIIGSEASFFNIFIQFWANGSFPEAASITIFIVACYLIFLLPNKVFAWFEYCTSLVKIILFLVIIFLSLAIVCGAGPAGYVHDGLWWRTTPAFKNGFSGFAKAAILAIWAVADQVFIGVVGGEVKNPQYSMAHAANLVPYRVGFVYMSCVMFITLLVSSDNPNLLGGSGTTASPFVIAVENVKIPIIADILNAGFMIGILAICAEAIYLSSRILRTLAHQRLIPSWFARVDSRGRPVQSLLITCAAGLLFAYLNLSSGGTTVLNWLVQISAASWFLNWMIIAFTGLRFRQAVAAQNDGLFGQLYAWKMSPRFPFPPLYLLLASFALMFCCLWLAILPPGSTLSDFSVSNFFEYTLGIWLIGALTLLYKIALRTPWRNPRTANLEYGRGLLSEEDVEQLTDYYALSRWRRFLTYIELW